MRIDRLSIAGFKSIRDLQDLPLGKLNVLIGANGSGETNFVDFFRFLRAMVDGNLQLAVAKGGGPEAYLFMGSKVTDRLTAKLYFDLNGYEFALTPTADNRLAFVHETLYFKGKFYPNPQRESLGSGHFEAKLADKHREWPHGLVAYVYPSVASWMVYHFHDTSESAGVKRLGAINDNETLRSDGSNLAAYLMRVRDENPDSYLAIRDAVRLVAPFFDDFKLRPVAGTANQTQLEWTQKGSDYPFLAAQLSDGTLRFMCLATALLQPKPPSTIVVDEPELGLHPYALTILASLFTKATLRTQVIASTQSATLLDYIRPADIIVVERQGDESIFRRVDEDALAEWISEYSLGELWLKNLLGGRPTP